MQPFQPAAVAEAVVANAVNEALKHGTHAMLATALVTNLAQLRAMLKDSPGMVDLNAFDDAMARHHGKARKQDGSNPTNLAAPSYEQNLVVRDSLQNALLMSASAEDNSILAHYANALVVQLAVHSGAEWPTIKAEIDRLSEDLEAPDSWSVSVH